MRKRRSFADKGAKSAFVPAAINKPRKKKRGRQSQMNPLFCGNKTKNKLSRRFTQTLFFYYPPLTGGWQCIAFFVFVWAGESITVQFFFLHVLIRQLKYVKLTCTYYQPLWLLGAVIIYIDWHKLTHTQKYTHSSSYIHKDTHTELLVYDFITEFFFCLKLNEEQISS